MLKATNPWAQQMTQNELQACFPLGPHREEKTHHNNHLMENMRGRRPKQIPGALSQRSTVGTISTNRYSQWSMQANLNTC